MATISDLCVNVKDQCDPATDRSGVYVGLEHIDSGTYRLRRHGHPSEIRSAKFCFQRGDILYGKLRPYLDKAVLAGENGICSTDILVLRPKANVVPAYVLGVVHSRAFQSHAVSTTHGLNHPRTSWSALASYECTIPSHADQAKVAAALWSIQRAIETEEQEIATARQLKLALMDKVFTVGLRGGLPRNTDAGLVPDTWEVERLDACCRVVSSSMPYTDLMSTIDTDGPEAVQVMGIKVSDMNLPGNEIEMASANLSKRMRLSQARDCAVPRDAVVFPKRGAAIATNKKRITTGWTILDPNLIAVEAGERIDPGFLYHWFQRFDLRTITEPGPTPQLNKKNLVPLLIPHPSTKEEQADVAQVFDTTDRAISGHDRKRAALWDLFTSLLDRLITGDIRVDKLDIDTSDLTAA